MTNPSQPLAAETINVDWFCFWLKGAEDPDPSKTEQHKRARTAQAPRGERKEVEGSSQRSAVSARALRHFAPVPETIRIVMSQSR